MLALLTSCSKNQTQQLQEFRDVIFAEVPIRSNEVPSDSMTIGTKSLTLNIWKGRGEDSQPVVLFVHGGAWVSGNNNIDQSDSEQIKAIMELRECGVTIAAPSYRFSFEEIFPAQIHDVKAAIRFLKAHAAEYGIDPDRIMTMGE